MKILAVNCGSSSLKFQMYEMPIEKVLISGNFERIGIDNSFYSYKLNGEKIKKEANLTNHAEAVKILVKELLDNKIVDSLDEIKGIGHRVVQGADKFDKSVLVTDEVIKTIRQSKNKGEGLDLNYLSKSRSMTIYSQQSPQASSKQTHWLRHFFLDYYKK